MCAQDLLIELEHSHLWYTYPATGGTRYFVTHVVVHNHSTQPRTVKLAEFALTANGREFHPLEPVEGPQGLEYESLKGFDFDLGYLTIRFSQMKPRRELQMPADGTDDSWVVFTDLPMGVDIPQLTLRTPSGSRPEAFDITALHKERLKLTVERLGPGNFLGLLRIDGALGSINAGTLVKAAEDLADDGVSRIVVVFSPQAKPVSEDLQEWLIQTADRQATGGTIAQLPTFPATIREFHLAALPRQEGAQVEQSVHVHESAAQAVTAALRSAYEVVAPHVAVEQLHKGHRLARIAVLLVGGDRLPPGELPGVLALVDDQDRAMSRAAVAALRHFPEPAAIDRLTQLAQGDDRELSDLALEALADSRFAQAREALLQVVRTEDTLPAESIIRLFSRYPLPEGIDLIATLLADDARPLPDTLWVEGLATLGRVGHPDLLELCDRALHQADRTLQQTAFDLLANRTDPQAEELALNYTLGFLQEEPPTPQMNMLLDRVRDPRAVPLLLHQLDQTEVDRAAIITLLARLGGPEIPAILVAHYPELKEPEQVAALNSLTQLQSSRLLELAPAALRSKNNSIVNAAINGLQVDGSDVAVALLAEAMRVEPAPSTTGAICAALREIGTDEARAVLRQLRGSSDKQVRLLAHNALQVLQENSPAKKHVDLGLQHAFSENWEPAIAQFSEAIAMDDELALAHSGRAHALLQLDRMDDAQKDFEQAVTLDPDDDIAVTGLAIVETRLGNIAAGIKRVKDVGERFEDENRFAYNVACVYGRAIEMLGRQPVGKQRDADIEEYRAAAVEALQRSIDLGFEDFDWMQEDPDLASLRDWPAFQKLTEPADENPDAPGEGQQRPRTIREE